MIAPRRLVCCAALLALIAGAAGTPARAAGGGGITLASAGVRLVDGVYLLDSVADVRLTQPVARALDNGVPLTFAWRVEIERERGWWPEAAIASVTQRFRIEYHALSLQYLVTNRNTGERRSFTRRRVALDFIATLIGYPIVDRMLLDEPGRHTGYARLVLEHDSLPLPLRPEALFSPAWYLASEWRSWSFE